LRIEYSIQKLRGKKTLIIGDLATGKTKLTAKLLGEAVQKGLSSKVTAIDMAPPRFSIKGQQAGGLLENFTPSTKQVRYLKVVGIKAPRLMARNPEELLLLARSNQDLIDKCLKNYLENPSEILFINDVSIYLQTGHADRIIKVMSLAETSVANGYYGEKLAKDMTTNISKHEREGMDRLVNSVEIVIHLEVETCPYQN